MATQISEDRGRFWPIVFSLLGCFNLIDYFYKFSFQPDDLLKGLGFLLVVPLAYRYPSAFNFKQDPSRSPPAIWAKWLAFTGFALVIAGFATEWL
jgi:hypothetical protein